MKLHEILLAKGNEVRSIGPNATLQEAVDRLVAYRIGSLLVCRPGASGEDEPVGIVTERDVLYACTSGRWALGEVKVSEVMTTELVAASPEDEIELVMGLMTRHHIRHLPVLSEGRLAGMISIGDVVKSQHDRLAMENRFMKEYIGK